MERKTDCEGHKKGEMMMIVMTKKGNPIKGKSDERENGLRGSQEGGKEGSQRGKSRLAASQQIVWLLNIVIILIILNSLNIFNIIIILKF